jgi:hypothetical protein
VFISYPKTVPVYPTRVLTLFAADPILDALPAPDMWALSEPCVYRSARTGVTVTCPVGVLTDLASTPKILQWIPFLDDDGASRNCGIVHDCLYRIGRERGKDFCDDLLEEMCLDVGMSKTEAWAYKKGVQLFGAGPWAKDGALEWYGDPRTSKFVSQADYEDWAKVGTVYS